MSRLSIIDKGFSVILMVMSLLIIASLVLGGLCYQLRMASHAYQQKKSYLIAHHQAWSGLLWAQYQSWHAVTVNWHCQQWIDEDCNICARLIAGTNQILLRVKTKSNVTLFALLNEQSSKGLILDYCPYPNEAICE